MTASGTHTYNSDKSRDANMAVAGYLEAVGLGGTHTNKKNYTYVAFFVDVLLFGLFQKCK